MGIRDTLRLNGFLPPKRGEMEVLPERDSYVLGSFLQAFTYLQNSYMVKIGQTLVGNEEYILGDFVGMVQGAYQSNGVVFACELARMTIFSEARLKWRQLNEGKPGDLFWTPELAIFDTPWPNGITGDLLTRMIQDADFGGNSYTRREGSVLHRLRPDWVNIVLTSDSDPDDPQYAYDTEIIGYLYYPGGKQRRKKPVPIPVNEMAHWAPIPDPLARFRGMSWLTPVLNEIEADIAATRHKSRFFANGATPNAVVKMADVTKREDFEDWIRFFEEKHVGVENAYKTLYLAGGMDMTVVGANLRQMDFKIVQGAGETRIAMAAGVPPIVAGLSEGLDAATYSNYGQARRAFGDQTVRPLWRGATGALSTIAPRKPGRELWYDDTDIPFLQEDQKDAEDILGTRSQTIRTLVEAGYEPESVKKAVNARDLSLLTHTGLFSVQLQPPIDPNAPPPPTPTNGANPAELKAADALAELLFARLGGNDAVASLPK